LRAPGPLRHAPIDAFQQIAELCSRDRHDTIAGKEPDEAPALQRRRRSTDVMTSTAPFVM
jgi:hypothetical protein